MTPRDLPPGSIIQMSDGRLVVPRFIVAGWPEPVQRAMSAFELDPHSDYYILPAHWQMPIGRIEHVMPPPSRAQEDPDATEA